MVVKWSFMEFGTIFHGSDVSNLILQEFKTVNMLKVRQVGSAFKPLHIQA